MDTTDRPLARATVSLALATVFAAALALLGTVLGLAYGNRAGTKRAEEDSGDLELQSKEQTERVRALSDELAERDAAFRSLSEKVTTFGDRITELNNQLTAKEAEIQRLRGQTPGIAEQENPARTLKPVATATEQGFGFGLMACTDEGSSIRCDVLITNRRADRWIWISSGYASRTYLVDTGGNNCSASESSFTWGTLAQDVPVRVTLEFTRCPRNVRRLSYLELGFQLGNPAFGSEFRVPFHDIPVTPG